MFLDEFDVLVVVVVGCPFGEEGAVHCVLCTDVIACMEVWVELS